jgi:hypothetical protein
MNLGDKQPKASQGENLEEKSSPKSSFRVSL